MPCRSLCSWSMTVMARSTAGRSSCSAARRPPRRAGLPRPPTWRSCARRMEQLYRAAWQSVTCDWRSICVLATVALRNMLPGYYHIYINAYDVEEVADVR